jgi:hypothetical protein
VRVIQLQPSDLLNARSSKSEDIIDRNELPEACEFASIDALKLSTEERYSVLRDEYPVSAVLPVCSARLLKQFAKDIVSSIVFVGREIGLGFYSPVYLDTDLNSTSANIRELQLALINSAMRSCVRTWFLSAGTNPLIRSFSCVSRGISSFNHNGDGGSGNAFNAFCTARRSCGACAMAML